jgi:hypothetical protein
MEFRTLAEGLQFPEGPVALADGSVLLVEIAAGTLTRNAPDGTKNVVATTGAPKRRRDRPDGNATSRTMALRMARAGPHPSLTPRITAAGGSERRSQDRRHRTAPAPAVTFRSRDQRSADAAGASTSPISASGGRARWILARSITRAGWLLDCRGRLSDGDAERHRPVADEKTLMSPRPKRRGSGRFPSTRRAL